MKKLVPILLMCVGASGAFAQKAANDGVTVSTDPAKAAAVEKHAQELKARAAQQQAQASNTTAKSSKTSSKTSSKSKSKAKKPAGAKPSTTK